MTRRISSGLSWFNFKMVIEKKTNRNGVEILQYTDDESARYFVKISYKNATLEKSFGNTEAEMSKVNDFIQSVNSPAKINQYLTSKTGMPFVFKERKKETKNDFDFRAKIERNQKSNQRGGKRTPPRNSPKHGGGTPSA